MPMSSWAFIFPHQLLHDKMTLRPPVPAALEGTIASTIAPAAGVVVDITKTKATIDERASNRLNGTVEVPKIVRQPVARQTLQCFTCTLRPNTLFC